MSRFTNEPCVACGEDTMHYLAKCSRCGTVAQRKQTWKSVKKRQVARMRARGLSMYVITAATVFGPLPKQQADAQRRETDIRPTMPDRVPQNGTFGKNRERTQT